MEERQWLLRNPILWFVLPLLPVAAIGAMIEGDAWAWALWLPAAFVASLNLNIRLAHDKLTLTYMPIWRRRIDVHSIIAADEVPYEWTRFGGWGIRFGQGAVAYSVWGKTAVRLTPREGRAVVFTTQHPQQWLQAIRFAQGLGSDRDKP